MCSHCTSRRRSSIPPTFLRDRIRPRFDFGSPTTTISHSSSSSHPSLSLRPTAHRKAELIARQFSDGRKRSTIVPPLCTTDHRASRLSTDVATRSLISRCGRRPSKVSFRPPFRRFFSLIKSCQMQISTRLFFSNLTIQPHDFSFCSRS